MTQYGSEKILPYNQDEHKGVQVRRMFDAIAGKYDLLNHTLSFGFDKGWRRKGIRFLRPYSPKQILDIATGTGDLAIAMQKQLHAETIIGADISEGMMEVGRQKVKEAGLQDHISFEYQDCTALTFADNTFDAVTAAFGVRNFEDIEKGLREMYRVTLFSKVDFEEQLEKTLEILEAAGYYINSVDTEEFETETGYWYVPITIEILKE